MNAIGDEGGDIALGGGVLPHFAIHGGGDENGGAARQGEVGGGQRIGRETVGELGEQRSGRGGDEKEVRLIGELDVAGFPRLLFIFERDEHRVAGESLQGQRRDELAGAVGHEAMDFVAGLDELRGEVRSLVGGDRSRDSQYDVHSISEVGADESGDAQTLGEQQRLEACVIFLAGGGNQAVLVFVPVRHFLDGIFESQGDDLWAIGFSTGESRGEFFIGGWHDKQIDKSDVDLWVGTGTDLSGPLYVDVHHDIFAAGDVLEDFRFQSAVGISMDGGVFEEISCGDFGIEFFPGEEKIIMAMDFTGAGESSGAGGGIEGFLLIGEATAERSFPRARGP